MTLSARHLLGRSLRSSLSLFFLLGVSGYAQVIPLEPFSPATDNPLSGAVISTRSGELASSAPNPRSRYSVDVISGQAMLFEFGAIGLGQYRVRIEDPDGLILQENILSDGEWVEVSLIAGKSGCHIVSLQPLTVEEVIYLLSASLNVIPDEEGNDSLANAQVIGQGMIPTGFHDRAVTVRSVSNEETEFFEIDLAAGESLSLAAEDRRLGFEIKNSLDEVLASSRSDVNGLSALIENYSPVSSQTLFIEVSNPRDRDYSFVLTISSPGETLQPPLAGHGVLDESLSYSNIHDGGEWGALLSSDGFSNDTYRLSLKRNQVIQLPIQKNGVGDLSYLLESPSGMALRQGSIEDEMEVSFVTMEDGEYFLTLSTTSSELVEYTMGFSGNRVKEPATLNDHVANAYPISYGWTKIGGCARLMTLSGQVGYGSSQFDVEPNNSLEEAQDLSLAEWSLEESRDILDSTGIPHTSLRGTGNGTKDYYRIESRVPNSRLICDIDRSFSLNSFLRVFDSEGNFVGENDGSETSAGAGGSTNRNDSLIDLELTATGTYYIEVGRSGGDGTLGNNDRYELHVSLENNRLKTVPESDPHDYYRIDLAEGERLTVACYQDDPFLEVFENGNPLVVNFYSRLDMPQFLSYRADSDTTLIVKLSNELVVSYDLVFLLNGEMDFPFHIDPASAMTVGIEEPVLAWVDDDFPDFYRVNFPPGDERTVTVNQIDRGRRKATLKIEVYNLNQELVLTSAPVSGSELSVIIPEELGNSFYLSVSQEAQSRALYLLQVGEVPTVCRDVFPSGSFSVEWPVIPEQSYRVEYSSDLLNWTRILEPVSSPGSILQWVDSGPPQTHAAPGVLVEDRYYRLVVPLE